MKSKLPVNEELDFAYLLTLMRPLRNEPLYTWLPELFSIIGHERLILLCKYAGGEVIQIPTVAELMKSIDALQWFYNVYISKKSCKSDIPVQLSMAVAKIKEVYDADES